MGAVTVDNRYYFIEKKILNNQDWIMAHAISRNSPTEAFLALASVCKIPLQVINIQPREVISLPISRYGQTKVTYVGADPTITGVDSYGNALLAIPAGCVVEVIFNRELPKASGKNKRAQAKKIIYVA